MYNMTPLVRKRERAENHGAAENDHRKRFRQALGGCEELPDDWVTTATGTECRYSEEEVG